MPEDIKKILEKVLEQLDKNTLLIAVHYSKSEHEDMQEESIKTIVLKKDGEKFEEEQRKVWKLAPNKKVIKVETDSEQAKVIRVGNKDKIIVL